MTLDQQFNTINEKLQQLLKQYNKLQKENDRLTEELKTAVNKDLATQIKLQELQQQVSILKVSSGEMTEKDKKDFERKINQYIKEVDKCISFLSE